MKIVTEEQYEKALTRVETLMDLRHSGAEDRELLSLVDAIEEYEAKYIDGDGAVINDLDYEPMECDCYMSEENLAKIRQGIQDAREGKIKPLQFHLDDDAEWIYDGDDY